ncbi:MMPL family transporter [Dactylosporangium vinaceum]|uniref:MMPL family transporter n=1 Tax=Dactylosporangium vinaceum TaxID=53362 RepID=A0ABV5M8Z3_9ACTN|nr:MMPL family transporter [Dactylosporangium vinaceum]UAB99512.1 MMPL family transporter [Dactylosporangium vinaceum]
MSKKLVILLWLAVVALGFGLGGGVFAKLTAQVATVPGSESERALDLREAAGGPPERHLTVVVTGGADVTGALEQARSAAGVAAVAPPLPSADGQAALTDITLTAGATAAQAAQVAEHLRAAAPGKVTVAGGPLTDNEFSMQAQRDVQRAEMITLPVVLILLVIVFGGLVAGLMPLIVAIAGTAATFGILYLASFVTDISVYAIQVATMLSLGLAVDYGLLLLSRYRTELAHTEDREEALRRAVRKAGRTIAVTGLTVAASLLGLTVFPDAFLRSMGLAGAGVVVVDMLAVLTLMPAVLRLAGRRIKPARPDSGTGVFARLARFVQRRPLMVTVLTAAAVLVLAVPSLHVRLANSDARALPTSTETRKQFDALSAHFPELVGPDVIAAVVRSGADDPRTAQFAADVRRVPGVSTVDVVRVADGVSVVRATPVHEPWTAEGRATLQAVRDVPAPFEVLVTGDAARLVDYRAMLAEYGPWAALVVLVATFALLAVFTRSVLLPIKAVLTSLLSIAAAFGAIVWVFQDGHLASWFGTERLGALDLTVPVLVAAIAFGLSVDYEVFLLARIRERYLETGDARAAVATGLQQTGRIVTSAALLLVVVFAGFLAGGFAPIKEIGLGLVVAIVLDATVVRMLLVPATMTLLGRANWWPSKPPERPSTVDRKLVTAGG